MVKPDFTEPCVMMKGAVSWTAIVTTREEPRGSDDADGATPGSPAIVAMSRITIPNADSRDLTSQRVSRRRGVERQTG